MEHDHSDAISRVVPAEPPETKSIRVRKVDWIKVLAILDAKPGEFHLIGEFDQSLRTKIREGRYSYIDPSLYEVVTRRIPDKPRTRADLYMRRREGS
jgi:hypothetical protein